MNAVESALVELRPLLDAVAATGASTLIKVEGERVQRVNPPSFTVVISGNAEGLGPIRFDGSDLNRIVGQAVAVFDARQ